MSFVITIGREYGSGGRYIASELAKKLNVNFYDGKLLEKVAEKAGFSLDYVQSNDEKKIITFLDIICFLAKLCRQLKELQLNNLKL